MTESGAITDMLLLFVAVICAAFTWAAHLSGEMQMRGGQILRADDHPRWFRFFMALRWVTATGLAAMAITDALGWIRFPSAA